jgi:hypothetical protein
MLGGYPCGDTLDHWIRRVLTFEKIPYALVEARRKNVLAHAAQFAALVRV